MHSVSPHQIDIIQAALAARGYKSGILSAFRSVELPAGSSLALQFGDEVPRGLKGLPTVILNCTCQINADDGPSAGLICLGVEKVHQVRSEQSFDLALKLKLRVGIEADFHVPSELVRGESAIQRAESYVYLESLLADAHETVTSLRIDPLENTLCGPAIRIEARLFGDIALGRTGVIRSPKAVVSSDYVRHASAACEWLRHRVLPELRSVIHELTGKSRVIITDRPARLGNQTRKSLPFLDANGTGLEFKTVQ